MATNFEDINWEQRQRDEEARNEMLDEENERILANFIVGEGITFELRAVNDEGEIVLIETSDESFWDVARKANDLDFELYEMAQSIHADNNDPGDFSEATDDDEVESSSIDGYGKIII